MNAPPAADSAALPAPDPARLAALMVMADPQRHDLPADGCEAARRAGELAAQLQRPVEQGRAGAWLCAHLLRLGQHADVLREAQPLLVGLLQAAELAAERRDLLRVLTLSASETADFDIALDAAHELVRITATLDEDGPALSAAFALAVCFERMGDGWQAARLLTQALQDHRGGAAELPVMMAHNGLCAVSLGLVYQLLGTEAETELPALLSRARAAGEAALAMLERLPNPAYEGAILLNLGEILLHQGELAASEPMLRRALAVSSANGLQAHTWRVRVSLAYWLLAQGDAQAALTGMQALISEMGAAAPQQTAIRAHHAAYRASCQLGLDASALHHLETVERLNRQRSTTQLRAQSRLFVTRSETQRAQWQADQARQDARHHRERAAEFAERAERDALTGLGNRRHLERRCAELLPAAQRDGQPLALAEIDIDHFKVINDRQGHAAGDQVLVALAQLLRDNTRAWDVLVRHGGEEFVVVLPGMGLDQAADVCERLRQRVAAHTWPEVGGSALAVTVSIGLAATPPFDAAALVQNADEALYRAKHGGRNRLCISGRA